MSRLTMKNENVDLFTGVKFEYETDDLYAVDKLGKLEDLEDQLGIDLLTLFKAFKDGIEVGNDKMRVCLKNCKLIYKKEDNEYAFIYDYYLVKLKDYGKNWWLKEDLKND